MVSCVGGEQTNERVNDFENICIKCGKMISEHPTTLLFYMDTSVHGIQTMSSEDSLGIL